MEPNVPAYVPAYVRAHESGLLSRRARDLTDGLAECRICPRNCGADRTEDGLGVCGIGREARVGSAGPHFGEERPLSGTHGSGTVFFSRCNLLCTFCQNEDLSHGGEGRPVTSAQLAAVFLALQRRGCHNLNLVTPSHVVPQILQALDLAAAEGLRVPLVYNTGGYDALDTLRALDGIVDIYMPDFKFWDPRVAHRFCGAADYPAVARAALREMQRQVGDLLLDRNGIAHRGVLVRHLVMPGGLAGSADVFRFLADEISRDTYVNVMGQYHPAGPGAREPDLDRLPGMEDIDLARCAALRAGLHRLDER